MTDGNGLMIVHVYVVLKGKCLVNVHNNGTPSPNIYFINLIEHYNGYMAILYILIYEYITMITI